MICEPLKRPGGFALLTIVYVLYFTGLLGVKLLNVLFADQLLVAICNNIVHVFGYSVNA